MPILTLSTYCIKDHFDNLDKFHASCGTSSDGKFTSSGTTIGECKLFAMLHACVMAKPTALDANPATKAFYERFLKEPQTQVSHRFSYLFYSA